MTLSRTDEIRRVASEWEFDKRAQAACDAALRAQGYVLDGDTP